MTNSNDQWIDNSINRIDDLSNACFSPSTEDFLARCISTMNTDGDYTNAVNAVLLSPNAPTQSPTGFSPVYNGNYHELSSNVSQAAALLTNTQTNATSLEIIAQPYYGSKLRYRSDYDNNPSRLGVLNNRTKDSSYHGPAIRIPPCYLNPNDGYAIRVSLVTIEYNTTGLHYIHPYELEHPLNEQSNDRSKNSVWFPIQQVDCSTGIKSFPTLRIVKRRAADLKNYGNLREFDCGYTNFQGNSLRQMLTAKDTINEFNLDHTQLAFVVGRPIFDHNNERIENLCPFSTVFSEEMIEGAGKETEVDSDAQSPTEKPVGPSPPCRVYKYAPKYGYEQSQEDMVIFLTTKPEPKRHGEIKVIFQCDTSGGKWSQVIPGIDVKDRMVSFKTPAFPYLVDETAAVDVIIQQDSRVIDTIKYYYIGILSSCTNCQCNSIQTGLNIIPNLPNKRPNILVGAAFESRDGPGPESDVSPKSKQLSPESSQESSSTTTDPNELVMNKLTESIQSLFLDNDYEIFFRTCRSVLTKSPELIHNSIEKNHLELMLKFIPTALTRLLQQKNELGETALLHALRLNRFEIIRELLKKEKSKELLESIDDQNNNIFHIIALNSIPLETIDLLIDHLTKNSINISEKFDCVNRDNWKPLQLAIYKNNLLATKSFLKHFPTNIHEPKTGDNLLHLAVRYGDLPMVKCLIKTGGLIQQVKQSNMQMTPKELAESLQQRDIVEYFNKILPPQEIDENDTSDDD